MGSEWAKNLPRTLRLPALGLFYHSQCVCVHATSSSDTMQWYAVAISFAPLSPPITVIIYFRLCSYASLSSSSKGLCMPFSLRKAVVQYGPAEGEKRRAGPHSRSGGSGRSTSIGGKHHIYIYTYTDRFPGAHVNLLVVYGPPHARA